MGQLGGSDGVRHLVGPAGGVGVHRERELVVPVELEARPGEGVVALLGLRVPLREIRGVGGDLVGDDGFMRPARSGTPRCSFGLTQHSIAVPAWAVTAAPIAEAMWSWPGATSVVSGP